MTFTHMSNSKKQTRPAPDNVQSLVPHAQSCALTTDPSVTAQFGKELHEFSAKLQNRPVVAFEQSLVSHAQSAELMTEPSALKQEGRWLQWLMEASQ